MTISIETSVFRADFQSVDDNLKNFGIGKDEPKTFSVPNLMLKRKTTEKVTKGMT